MSDDPLHEILKEWEPIPYNTGKKLAAAQQEGFRLCALKPLVWWKIDFRHFPAEGVFGYDRDWCSRHEVEFVTVYDGEEYLLIDRCYFGFPDPPQYGLASRPAGKPDAEWSMWGSFWDWPSTWSVMDA